MARWVRAAVCGGVLSFGLAVPSAEAQVFTPSTTATVTLRGTVRGVDGAPIVRAEVLVEGTTVRALTQANGTYALVGVPVGVVRLMARRLGYLPTRMDFEVAAVGAKLDWSLPLAPAQLSPLVVTARREPFDARLSGFRDRSEKRQGGHFVTRERIERSGSRQTLDVLRAIPGVRFVTPGRGQPASVRLRSSRCPPLVFIDGFPATATEFDLASIDLHMIEGIEVYLSSTTVPSEFLGPRGLEQCGVIAFWSRPTQLRPPRPLRRQEAAAADRIRAAAFSADQVEEPAVMLTADAEVTYPDSLWRAGVPGGSTVEFVVNPRGQIDWDTLREVSATHPDFMRAVMESLRNTQWRAARKGGEPVAQVVVFAVSFARPNIDG